MRTLASLTGAAALLFLVSATTAARADDDGAPPAATTTKTTAATTATRSTATETSWYGWQTLAVDGGSIAMGLALGSAGHGGAGGVLALGGYVFGGPIVHAAHGHTDAVLGDLGLRLGAPLLGSIVGYGVGVATFQGCGPSSSFLCGRDWAGIGGAVYGGLGGAVTAVILDAALLGRERVRKDDVAAPAPRGVRWTPQVAVSPRGEPSVGVGGSF